MGFAIRRTAALLVIFVCLLGAATAGARITHFRPRIGMAMGLEPAARTVDYAVGANAPVVYHGGPVMSGKVTVHTIFWSPSGFPFDDQPAPGVLDYESLIQRFFTDVAHDSGMSTNIFSLLDQYGDNAGPGHYSIAYDPSSDTIADTDSYPPIKDQCPSTSGTAVCLTDLDVSREIDHVITRLDPSGYGLHDLWEIYLPANVDECIGLGSCATNDYAGYHSLADHGHGAFIYAVMIDGVIEASAPQGADPQGNPQAEATIDTAGHETMEAITNPEGDAWMDPNGNEVADKCENGPQIGTPLGYATDGSPYNQVIDGHPWLVQDMWSNPASGCVSSSTVTTDGLPLASVSLRQFSPDITGNIGKALGHVAVQAELLRAGAVIADAGGLTRRNGSWGPITFRGPHGVLHAVGDDRDELLVGYGRGGPESDLIATGAGGNPFTEAGWTDWLDLDTGAAVNARAVVIAPCSQTGALTVTVNGRPTAPLLAQCQTETDATTVRTAPLTDASRLVLTSEDNRAVSPLAPAGAEISLSVPLGEPGSVPTVINDDAFVDPTGVPICTADLRIGDAICGGLVPGARYTLTRSRGHVARRGLARSDGTLKIADFPGRVPITGGDVLSLSNSAHRTLTVFHVAHLRVAIDGDADIIASGRCQPDDYMGAPLTKEPSSDQVGDPGAAGLGTICPASGRAAGLSGKVIAEIDDLSGGITHLSLPFLEGTAPSNDAIVPSSFRALAQTGIPEADGGVAPTAAAVSVVFRRARARQVVFRTANVSQPRGVAVPHLRPGVYRATWVIHDRNGDTRTVQTRFVVGA